MIVPSIRLILAQVTASETTTEIMEPPAGEEITIDAGIDETSNTGAEVSIVGREVKGLLGEALQGDVEAIVSLSVSYLLPAVGLLVMLIAAYFVARFVSQMVSGPVSKRVDPTLGRFLGKLIFYLIMIGAVLGVLGGVGVNVAAFAAVLAAAGFAIGLAFQGTLSNFAAGIMLLIFRPFKVGDAINAAGITAKVAEIDLFFTIFDTFDNRRIIVPNSDVFGGTIENITFHPVRRADVNVGVAYDSDLDQARAALNRAAESVEGLQLGEGRGHQVMLKDLGALSIDWVVRAWFTKEDFWTDREKLIQAIKRELDTAAVTIPFPQMDVHLDRGTDTATPK